MADIKWIKLYIDIFDNRKLKQIKKLPESDAIIVIWFELLCLCGKINDNGLIYLTQEVPYTEEMLANEFDRPLAVIQLALRTFEAFGMLEIIDDIYCISNWKKYQNIEGMEKIREQNRIRKQNQRIRQRETKALEDNSHVMSRDSHVAEVEVEIEVDKDIDKDIEEDKKKEVGAVPPDTSLLAIELLLKSDELYPIYQEDISLWQESYRLVNVTQELLKMKSWCEANPTKRKTKGGIRRFINGWLCKEQEKQEEKQKQSSPKVYDDDYYNSGDVGY